MVAQMAFTSDDVKSLAKLVYTHAGIVLGEHKKSMMYSRLAPRIRELGFADFSEYCDLLESRDGNDEVSNVLNAVSTNVTAFFREAHHFEHLRHNVFKPLVVKSREGGVRKVRIWSAGCSTGEETYSIAMTMVASIPNIDSWNAKILATDIDTNVLEAGQKGIYREKDTADIPNTLKVRYLTRDRQLHEAGKVKVVPSLTDLISFKRLNFLEHWPFGGPFDAIFCRNVMIYFDEPTRAKLIERFYTKLAPGGFLYIGHSESLVSTKQFKLAEKTVYRRLS